MKRFLNIIALSLLLISLISGRSIYLYDIWTGQPVVGALIITPSDTLVSNCNGYVDISGEDDAITIAAQNYYTENFNIADLQKPLIYLEPYDYTETITVVRPAQPDSRLSISTNISRINLDIRDDYQPPEKLLDEQSGISIKSYGGYGQIQTISLRGMSAAQTQTLLDGIPLNNLQMGNFNFSSLSLNALQGIDIYRGGNYIFGGSGSIGGVINLQSLKPQDYLNYSLFYQNASWNNNLYNVRLDLPFANIRQTFFFEQASGNNDYTVNDYNKEVTLQNHDYKKQHLNYKGEIILSPKNRLELFVSSYKNENGAPAAYVNENSERANKARISNDNTLSRIKFIHYNREGSWFIQSFFRNSWMEYKNPNLPIDGQALHSTHYNGEQGMQARWKRLFFEKLLINVGMDASQQKINSSEAGSHRRNQFSFYTVADWLIAQHLWYIQAIHLHTAGRFESYSDFGRILLPGISLSASVKKVNIYASAGKNYRAPSFNDLYWQPGGNAQLSAEKSNNFEIGADYSRKISSFILTVKGSFYVNNVSQQIKWMPGELFWRPQNIAAVLSEGVEFEIEALDINRINKISFNYFHGSAVKNAVEFNGDNTMGNQLPFIPKEKWALSAGSGFWKIRYGARAKWNSFRYVTLENNEFLPSYFLLDIYAVLHLSIWKQDLDISFSLNNLTNKQYEVMKGYPMPPRNYQISLRFGGKP